MNPQKKSPSHQKVIGLEVLSFVEPEWTICFAIFLPSFVFFGLGQSTDISVCSSNFKERRCLAFPNLTGYRQRPPPIDERQSLNLFDASTDAGKADKVGRRSRLLSEMTSARPLSFLFLLDLSKST